MAGCSALYGSGKNLVIVESPAKAKTLEKFLGKDFRVLASYGHVRDLPRKGLGVDRENAYEPTYEVLAGKEKTLGELKNATREASAVFLAADPDREGEAISWHLHEALRSSAKDKPSSSGSASTRSPRRPSSRAMEDAGEIDARLVDAQQARRIIDRLVGYEVSDLLWKKIWRGLSAGRVQTVALRIIVEREREIEAFKAGRVLDDGRELEASAPPPVPRAALLLRRPEAQVRRGRSAPGGRGGRRARARKRRGRGLEESRASRRPSAARIRRPPSSPRSSSRPRRGASPSRCAGPCRSRSGSTRGATSPAAERVGLITYMRTDSTRVSDEALAAVREHIGTRYGAGPESLPESPRFFKSKRGAQDAHEAIRPTYLDLPPDAVAPHLSPEEAKLYRLIWERFVASQMSPAVYDATSSDIEAGRAVYRASGSTLKSAGLPRGLRHRPPRKRRTRNEDGSSRLPPLSRARR